MTPTLWMLVLLVGLIVEAWLLNLAVELWYRIDRMYSGYLLALECYSAHGYVPAGEQELREYLDGCYRLY